jgi:hypothetical protein
VTVTFVMLEPMYAPAPFVTAQDWPTGWLTTMTS